MCTSDMCLIYTYCICLHRLAFYGPVPTRNNNTRIPHLVGMCGSSTSSRTWNRHSYGGYIEVVVLPGHIWIFHVSWSISLQILIPQMANLGFSQCSGFSPIFFGTWESPMYILPDSWASSKSNQVQCHSPRDDGLHPRRVKTWRETAMSQNILSVKWRNAWVHIQINSSLGKIPNLTNILQMGWNHQPASHVWFLETISSILLKFAAPSTIGRVPGWKATHLFWFFWTMTPPPWQPLMTKLSQNSQSTINRSYSSKFIGSIVAPCATLFPFQKRSFSNAMCRPRHNWNRAPGTRFPLSSTGRIS